MISLLFSLLSGAAMLPPEEPKTVEVKEVYDKEEKQIIWEEFDVEEQNQKAFILDMDFCTDVDDVCALRVAQTLDRQEVIDLKAVTLTTNAENNENITAVDGMLAYYEMDVPIGKPTVYIPDTSPYWNVLSEYSDKDFEEYDSVKLWRRIISENEKTTIVTTGYLTNLSEFCKSGPDEYSDETGMELLEKTDIYIVGGSVPTGKDNNFSFTKEAREATSWIVNNVDYPLIIITNNIGGTFKCGGKIQSMYQDDPVSKSLSAFGTSDGRAAWDPTGVYVAAFGVNEEEFKKIKTSMDFKEDGTNTFDDGENGKYIRIEKIMPDEYYSERIEELTLPVN